MTEQIENNNISRITLNPISAPQQENQNLTEEIKQDKEGKIFPYLKKNYNFLVYIILAVIVFLAVKVRTNNLPNLRDITTGEWSLGPDLDPFLFLRWAEYILEHGSLFSVDLMRYVPLGYETSSELVLHPHLMVWFHKIAVIFGSESITQSSAVYPVFMFALAVIAFFFFSRKLFIDSLGIKKANILALIASLLLATSPSILGRTIAGIPEKESSAFIFLFLALYFFISAWKAKSLRAQLLFALGAGISTGLMALVWGGYLFIFLTIIPTFFIAFLLGKVDKNKLYLGLIFITSTFLMMLFFTARYPLRDLFASVAPGSFVLVLFIIAFHLFIYPKIKNRLQSPKIQKIPPKIISTIISLFIIAIIATIFLGPSFIPSQITAITNDLINPATTRLLQTVSENKQPFFSIWADEFGPIIFNKIPLTFWIFFISSVYLFIKMIKVFNKKERIILSSAYTIFLLTTLFSRFSEDSKLDGITTLSLSLYVLGFILLAGSIGFYYYKYHKNNQQGKLQKIEFSLLILFSFFLVTIFAGRGAVRFLLMVPTSISIVISYFIVSSFNDTKEIKDPTSRKIAWALIILLISLVAISSFSLYQKSNLNFSPYFSVNPYQQQWQKAMFWVRENTPEDAVFAHWWDYGYWVQTIGKRATILDGGNAISYWNYLMSRHVLTSPDEKKTLEFLYAHNATHLLIDSSDVKKYVVISLIGSDENLDRRSSFSPFIRENSLSGETKESLVQYYIYEKGVIFLTQDILYEQNETRVFLPKDKAAIGGVLIERDSSGRIYKNPKGIFIYKDKQYYIPLRYAFEDDELIDFDSGIESGVFTMHNLITQGEGFANEEKGVLLYLDERAINSRLAKLYLFNEESPYFKLVHTEDNVGIAEMKAQFPDFDSEFLYIGERIGPIKIWEISYPEDIKLKPEYIETQYPEELQRST